MSLKIKNKNGEWCIDQKAIQTSIIDLENNFKSNTVEGALKELAREVKDLPALSSLEGKIEQNRIGLSKTNIKVKDLEEDVEWLKENGGGGGGGTIVPTITSSFTDCAIDKGSDVTIPIFFSSPSGGNGTAYVMVNNIEVDYVSVKQGNNNVKILGTHFNQTDNRVAIYVKDRAGIVSNQLEWNVIAGGITLTTTFDYEVDYGITDEIRMPYNIETGIDGEITLFLTVDGEKQEIPSVNGYNEYLLSQLNLGLGTHSVSMYATVGKYTSKTISFNVVIVSTTELYLSSSFVNGSKFPFGVPISINYRLSKLSSETYNVYLSIDGVLTKTQSLTVGSYYWTVDNLEVGHHILNIRAVSKDELEDVSLSLSLEVEKGEYTPVADYEYGLLCDLNALGKNNQDDTGSVWIDSSGNKNHGNLIGFNFATNGFIENQLVCDNDAYVEIPWSPWSNNATKGSTIDIIYTPINSGIEDCRVLDYTDITDDTSTSEVQPFKGVFADVTQAIASSASSGQSAGKVSLDDESGEIHLTWVLDRDNKFLRTYIDGVLSRIMYLTDSGSGTNQFFEDFSHDNYIYLNSTKGANCGTNNIKRFRVYNHALTSDNVLQNHLANIKDLEEQERLYNFNYKNTTLPKMYLHGDVTNMTHEQTVDMRIEYRSPNEEKFGSSFNTGIQNNPVRIQGTSSLAYVRKNYTIFLKNEYGSKMMYNPYGNGSMPEDCFCLKCDYVESSHANNTGMAKFVNDCVYTTKLPTQLDNENCRSAINGFPIELYMNGEYMGIYNFNHDRYSTESFGYNYKKYPNMLVYEINSNSNTSAGAFYKYGENAESSANISERDYYARDFKLIYGNRTSTNDSYAEIKELVEWVSIAEQDLFRETISEHFNKEYLFRYLLTVLLVGGVDSLGKNMKINSFDGKVWYPTFYDIDTCLGVDNSGYLTILPDVEIEEGSFNTSNSNLWTKVLNYFARELNEEWGQMRQGNFTLENIMKYIYGEQISSIPTKAYNMDADTKYLQFGSLYTYCCHGSKEHLVKRWIRERIAYVDSMLEYFVSASDQVILRMNKTGEVNFNVTSYIPLYFSVKWSNAQGGTQRIKVKRGESVKFSFNSTTNTDQEVIVYHAKHIKRLDNLSNLNPSSCILASANKLTEVEIHSNLLYNVNVTNNTFLRKLDLEGCEALGTVTAVGSSLDLSKCRYLQYANTYNTNLTEVILDTKGGSIKEVYYPKTIQSISLIKQPLLEMVGLPYGSNGEDIPTALYSIDIRDCTGIKKLNTSANNTISSSMKSMAYCNNLTLRNSLDLKTLTFDGFKRLKNVTIENMFNLQSLGFDNMLDVGKNGTLGYIGLSNCPKLSTISMNCTSNAYEISFLDGAILNFGKLTSLTRISSNCVVKGLKTIVIPKSLEVIDFTTKYGFGESSIVNIWSGETCSVDTSGTTPTVTHVIKDYEGIDFKGINIKSIDMLGFSQIKNGINFNLAPTTTNPNLNTGRDGSLGKPWFRPSGTLDIRNYEGAFAGLFKGLDLDKINIIFNDGTMEHTDISSLFEGTTFENAESVNSIIRKFPYANKLDYILKNADIETADGVVFPKERFTLRGGFSGSKLVSDIDLPLNVVDVVECFKDCKSMTNVKSNWTKTYPRIVTADCYEGCTNIAYIDYRAGKIDDIPREWGGHEFGGVTTGVYVFEIPEDNYRLVLGDLIDEGTVTWGDGSYTRGVSSYVYDVAGTYIVRGKVSVNPIGYTTHASVKTSLRSVLQMPSKIVNYRHMFSGCGLLNLIDATNINTSKVENMSNTFNGCTSLISSPSVDLSSVREISGLYAGCVNLTNVRFKNLANEISDISNILDGCNKVVTLAFEGRTNKVSAKAIIQALNDLVVAGESSLSALSNSVNELVLRADSLDLEQEIQDTEIIMNMVASVDIFEMVMGIIGGMSTKNKKTVDSYFSKGEGGFKMVEVYVTLIIKGVKTIDDVPAIIRPQVIAMLKEMGVEVR